MKSLCYNINITRQKQISKKISKRVLTENKKYAIINISDMRG